MKKEDFSEILLPANIYNLNNAKQVTRTAATTATQAADQPRVLLYGTVITGGLQAFSNAGFWEEIGNSSVTLQAGDYLGNMEQDSTFLGNQAVNTDYFRIYSCVGKDNTLLSDYTTDCDSGVPGVSVSSLITNLPESVTSNGSSTSAGSTYIVNEALSYQYDDSTNSNDTYTIYSPSISRTQVSSRIIILAGHEISEVTAVILAGTTHTISATTGQLSGSSYDFCMQHLGTSTQKADFLACVFNKYPYKWLTTSTLADCAYVHLIGQTINNSDLLLKVNGAKLYDIRDSSTAFSDNPVLAAYHYLTNSVLGMGISSSYIDTSSFETAADICEESVDLLDTSTESRYAISAAITTSEDQLEALSTIVNSYGGYLYVASGKIKTLAAKYVTPTVELSEDDFISGLSVSRLQDFRDMKNSVYGSFSDITNSGILKVYPSLTNSTYKTLDGNVVRPLLCDLPYTPTHTMAQRLSKIQLIRSRVDTVVTVDVPLKYLDLEVGDTIGVTFSALSWSNKSFLIVSTSLNLDGDPSISLTLIEENSSTYAWDESTEEQDPVITAAEESYTVPVVTGLSVSSGNLVWTAPTGDYISDKSLLEIQCKNGGSLNYGGYPSNRPYFSEYTDTSYGLNIGRCYTKLNDESVPLSIVNICPTLNYANIIRVRVIDDNNNASDWVTT